MFTKCAYERKKRKWKARTDAMMQSIKKLREKMAESLKLCITRFETRNNEKKEELPSRLQRTLINFYVI